MIELPYHIYPYSRTRHILLHTLCPFNKVRHFNITGKKEGSLPILVSIFKKISEEKFQVAPLIESMIARSDMHVAYMIKKEHMTNENKFRNMIAWIISIKFVLQRNIKLIDGLAYLSDKRDFLKS